MNREQAIERLEFINTWYDYGSTYQRQDVESIGIALTIIKEQEDYIKNLEDEIDSRKNL